MGPRRFHRILGELKTRPQLYSLVGIMVCALIHSLFDFTGEDKPASEALIIKATWPMMVLIFLVYFIRGLLE